MYEFLSIVFFIASIFNANEFYRFVSLAGVSALFAIAGCVDTFRYSLVKFINNVYENIKAQTKENEEK